MDPVGSPWASVTMQEVALLGQKFFSSKRYGVNNLTAKISRERIIVTPETLKSSPLHLITLPPAQIPEYAGIWIWNMGYPGYEGKWEGGGQRMRERIKPFPQL